MLAVVGLSGTVLVMSDDMWFSDGLDGRDDAGRRPGRVDDGIWSMFVPDPSAAGRDALLSSEMLSQEAVSAAVSLLTAADEPDGLLEQLVDELCLYRSERVRIASALGVLHVASAVAGRRADPMEALEEAVPAAEEAVAVRFGRTSGELLRLTLTAALAHAHGEFHLCYQLLSSFLADSAPSHLRFGCLYTASVLAVGWAGEDSEERMRLIRQVALAVRTG